MPMVSPVKSRLTHYENLGLSPRATPDEIAEAFAKQIRITITSPEEAVEHADRVYIAYETLRDPIRRHAYDAAIGLWDQEAAAKQKVEPFIGARARESPEQGLHVTSSRGPSEPAKKPGRRRKPANKAAIDREALSGTLPPAAESRRPARRAKRASLEWPVPKTKSFDHQETTPVAGVDRRPLGGTPGRAKKDRRRARPANRAAKDPGALPKAAKRPKSAAEPGAVDRITAEHRDGAFHRADQARSLPVIGEAAIKQNYVGAGVGVTIVAFGFFIILLGLTRGNYDQPTQAPRRPIAVTDKQPSVHTEARATAAEEQAVPVDQIQPQASGRASSPDSAARRAAQQSAALNLGQQATSTPIKRIAGLKPAATPTQQSATGETAGRPREQVRVAIRPPALTPPQQMLYRPTLPPTESKGMILEAASGQVSSSAIEEKICKQLPSSWSRLPQPACLTEKEWKQVEEELR
jgi:curved DNA-binding protein CbpA